MDQCPPPAPLSQKSYWVMASPSASDTVNKVVAANGAVVAHHRCWRLSARDNGAVLAPVALTDTQALYWMPSLARSQIVSVPAPPRYVTCESCEAGTKLS